MKPIQTVYKGYRFRSRLEARWAVFFDALGVKWSYEHEGFELPGGGRYLPDFFLPEIGLWVEIKPGALTVQEVYKATQLVAGTKQPLFISAGMPDEYGRLVWHTTGEDYEIDVSDETMVSASWNRSYVEYLTHDPTLDKPWLDRRLRSEMVFLHHSPRRVKPLASRNLAALEAARAARFEFGEVGA